MLVSVSVLETRYSVVYLAYSICLLCPRAHKVGALRVDGRPLSVRRSVCPMPDPKSRMEGRGKVKIDGKEAHDTGDP